MLPELQVRLLLVALEGVMVALRVTVAPTKMVAVLGSILTPVALMTTFSTTTLIEAALPLAVLAVIVTVPAFFPVTMPLPFTVAIFEFALDQVTVLLVALAGLIVTLSLT